MPQYVFTYVFPNLKRLMNKYNIVILNCLGFDWSIIYSIQVYDYSQRRGEWWRSIILFDRRTVLVAVRSFELSTKCITYQKRFVIRVDRLFFYVIKTRKRVDNLVHSNINRVYFIILLSSCLVRRAILTGSSAASKPTKHSDRDPFSPNFAPCYSRCNNRGLREGWRVRHRVLGRGGLVKRNALFIVAALFRDFVQRRRVRASRSGATLYKIILTFDNRDKWTDNGRGPGAKRIVTETVTCIYSVPYVCERETSDNRDKNIFGKR
ncbi:hypothetical protein AGLY_007967 [Aphis glycines]|uniref:Uncharacterized protein n=1 Tax=Aphis glycines TaxID=307491 RepID=A0A6G0TLU1_APHGL|nr:hypothetical protein AGLY_007967 [Aphis glycines]